MEAGLFGWQSEAAGWIRSGHRLQGVVAAVCDVPESRSSWSRSRYSGCAFYLRYVLRR